jgi:pyrroline-5-carboxylate reductase
VSEHHKIAFIGAGNMARSLIRGLLATGYPAGAICASDPAATQREGIASLGIKVLDDNNLACAEAAVVVLAVKPQVLGQVLSTIEGLKPDQLIVSIAAGVPVASLLGWTSARQAIVTALYANDNVSPAQHQLADKILSAAGRTLRVAREAELDAVTAVSGSGPAYFFYLMEAMIEAGVALGLDTATATTLTLETAYGAALMARQGEDDPATLRHNVTSPGGTTERALSILDAAGTRDTVHKALAGAAQRSKELAEEFGQS